MDKMRETLLKIQTELIYAALSGGMKLPDPVLAEIISQFRRISSVLAAGSENGEMMMRLDELEGYFRERSPLSDALRSMILDARPSQFKSTIRGYLVNYVYEW